MTAEPLPSDYQAALEGAAWYVVPDSGCLAIRGRDRAGYLQRQTTHDIRLLTENRALPSILTSPNARILDVLYLISGSDETILALTLPGQAAITTDYLNKRIFFMDQVEVKNISEHYIQIDLVGPRRGDISNQLGFMEQPGPDEILRMEWEEQPIFLMDNSAPVWLGWRLLIPSNLEHHMIEVLEDAPARQLTGETYRVLHLETGTPQAPAELNEAYTPLETNLQAAISDAKGCYTGQEIIARQINYDKVTQKLCGLRLTQLPINGDFVWVDNRAIGKVTSFAISPRFGPIGLAILRRPHFEAGTQVQIGSQPDQSQEAIVCSLPFEL